MSDKAKLFKKLKNMKQYANATGEELNAAVEKRIKEEELTNSFEGLDDTEIKKALELYDQYISENSFENLAEKSTLVGLIYKEILKIRVQQYIKQEGDNKKSMPLPMIEKIMDLDAQILTDKEKLGMLKSEDNASFVTSMNELKKKALAYYNEHAGETYVRCPECQKMFRLLMNVEGLEICKANFFKGTTLYNKKVLDLYDQKRLTIDEVTEILGVHQKYVDFIYNNIYLKEKDKEQTK